MQITLPMVRTEHGLKATNERGREALKKIALGDQVIARFHRPRSIQHHNWFWALLAVVGEAKGWTADQVLTMLKVKTGRVDFLKLENGTVVASPRSISFGSMTEDEFAAFSKEAVAFILENILPGVTNAELQAKIEELTK